MPKGTPHGNCDADVDLFPSSLPREKNAKPTLPAFLVPAVIDALKDSPKYAPVVKLVPGEADGFCARHVRSNGGMIFTSDTDLLVHDLGSDGSVAFFADIELDSETQRLVAPQYRPADLCRRLSIEPDSGLIHLAFMVKRETHLSFEQALERTRRADPVSTYGKKYSTFVGEYLTPEVASTVTADQIPALDPRVSELALQSLRASGTATPVSENKSANPTNGDHSLELYLPFLLDCPSRTSSWEASKTVRQLAYAVLQTTSGTRISSVSEMRRMQTESSGLKIDVPELSETDELAISLLALLSRIEAGLSNSEITWTVLSIYQDIAMTVDRARGSPLSLEILGQEARGKLDECSWDFLHLLAQTQATYYSFRILAQILEFSTHRGSSLSPAMLKLNDFLSRLPPLSEFPSPRTFADTLRLVRESGGLPCLEGLCADVEDILPHIEAIQRPQETKKTKKRKAARSSGEGPAKARSRNPFDLLAGQVE